MNSYDQTTAAQNCPLGDPLGDNMIVDALEEGETVDMTSAGSKSLVTEDIEEGEVDADDEMELEKDVRVQTPKDAPQTAAKEHNAHQHAVRPEPLLDRPATQRDRSRRGDGRNTDESEKKNGAQSPQNAPKTVKAYGVLAHTVRPDPSPDRRATERDDLGGARDSPANMEETQQSQASTVRSARARVTTTHGAATPASFAPPTAPRTRLPPPANAPNAPRHMREASAGSLGQQSRRPPTAPSLAHTPSGSRTPRHIAHGAGPSTPLPRAPRAWTPAELQDDPRDVGRCSPSTLSSSAQSTSPYVGTLNTYAAAPNPYTPAPNVHNQGPDVSIHTGGGRRARSPASRRLTSLKRQRLDAPSVAEAAPPPAPLRIVDDDDGADFFEYAPYEGGEDVVSLRDQLAAALAEVHSLKKYGRTKDSDVEYKKRLADKIYKLKWGARSVDNVEVLSDLSDEEKEDNFEPPDGIPIYAPTETKHHFAFAGEDSTQAYVREDTEAIRWDLQRQPGQWEQWELESFRNNTGKVSFSEYLYTLTRRKGNVPVPVGKFGQPFWPGSAWEDFDPRRLNEEKMKEKGRICEFVAVDSELWEFLVMDARSIPFRYRSWSQRRLVSYALRVDKVLTAAERQEPDVLAMCRFNPLGLPFPIRRQYRHDDQTDTFYVEYDVGDLDLHCLLKIMGPAKRKDRSYQEQYGRWLRGVDRVVLSWLPNNLETAKALKIDDTLNHNKMYCDYDLALLPNEQVPGSIYQHLRSCGLSLRRLLEGGDFHDYIKRSRHMEHHRGFLQSRFEKLNGPGHQTARRKWVADRMIYDPIPPKSPVIRVALTPERVASLAMKYTDLARTLKDPAVYQRYVPEDQIKTEAHKQAEAKHEAFERAGLI